MSNADESYLRRLTPIVGISLIAVGLIGVFPPRSKYIDGVATHRPMPRGFLFASDESRRLDVSLGPAGDDGMRRINSCRIDTGRLLCEVLFVGLLSGVVIVFQGSVKLNPYETWAGHQTKNLKMKTTSPS